MPTDLLLSDLWAAIRDAQGLREHPLVDVAGTNFRNLATLVDRIANELERLQADAERLDALQKMTEVNGHIAIWCHIWCDRSQWHIKAGERRIPQAYGGLRDVIDNLRQWVADDKAQKAGMDRDRT